MLRWGGLKGVGDNLRIVPEDWPASGAHPLLQVIFLPQSGYDNHDMT